MFLPGLAASAPTPPANPSKAWLQREPGSHSPGRVRRRPSRLVHSPRRASDQGPHSRALTHEQRAELRERRRQELHARLDATRRLARESPSSVPTIHDPNLVFPVHVGPSSHDILDALVRGRDPNAVRPPAARQPRELHDEDRKRPLLTLCGPDLRSPGTKLRPRPPPPAPATPSGEGTRQIAARRPQTAPAKEQRAEEEEEMEPEESDGDKDALPKSPDDPFHDVLMQPEGAGPVFSVNAKSRESRAKSPTPPPGEKPAPKKARPKRKQGPPTQKYLRKVPSFEQRRKRMRQAALTASWEKDLALGSFSANDLGTPSARHPRRSREVSLVAPHLLQSKAVVDTDLAYLPGWGKPGGPGRPYVMEEEWRRARNRARLQGGDALVSSDDELGEEETLQNEPPQMPQNEHAQIQAQQVQTAFMERWGQRTAVDQLGPLMQARARKEERERINSGPVSPPEPSSAT
eukprot:Hpha_TRINITY_DN2586_c0_g1::TRINITY_DN2586_c0_g1_i1::g.1487::m.1487